VRLDGPGLTSIKYPNVGNAPTLCAIFMKSLIFLILIFSFNTSSICQSLSNTSSISDQEFRERFTRDTLKGVYIPYDLNDCFRKMDEMWSDSLKQIYKNHKTGRSPIDGYVDNFSLWMRNSWGLWTGSRLSQYFFKYGIYYADNISGDILSLYQDYLNGKNVLPINDMASRPEFNKVDSIPSKRTFPKNISPSDLFLKIYYKRSSLIPGVVHFARDHKTKHIWLYDYYYGWVNTKQNQFQFMNRLNKENIDEIFLKFR
jgi:hypothetical protein